MADIQAEIARVCRLLESDKITERKLNYVKIKGLLSEKETQKLLDVNSDSGKKNVINWDFVFKYTQAYVNREMECLRNQKPRNSQTPSSTVANNREKKKKEIVALLKFVIKIADERERYRLNGKDVVQHIITILVNQDMNGMFVADYQNIFLKYVLTSKTYRCEITCKMWHDLIDIFAKMVTSSVGERSFSAKIFSYVIISASNQVDVKSSKLFTFFGNAFTDVRHETNSHVLEYLLGALISFSNAVAIDCRGHLCQLGEDLTPVLLHIWNKPHLVIKERLVQFMRLQVRLHHPDGVHCEKDGAWSTNSTYWKKCLQRMYEAISSEIQQISGRIRVQSSKLESGLKQPLIELAGDVCHQLFFPSVLPLDTKIEGPSPSKRRKLDVGWSALRDILTNGQETSALLAWLQITANLLQKFPDDLPSKEYVPLLTSLHQLQMECKRQEIIANSMICLKFVALCHVQLIKDSVEKMSAKSTWKNIWHAALRSCSSHGLEDESFELLEIIVKQKLAEPDTEPWKLLTETGCSSSVRSLQFLWFYLKTLPLPEHFYCNTRVFSAPPFQFYPLRHQLFDWILPPPKRVEQQGGVASSCYSKILSRLPMELLSRVLVILTQRICHNNKSFVETFSVERNALEQFENDLKTMENLYMLSSLDKNAVTKLVDPVEVESNKCVSSDNNTVELLLDYLVKRLLEISETLLKTPDCESNSSVSSPSTSSAFPDKRLEVLTRYCSLSTKVMGLLLYFNAFSTGELTNSSLHQTTMRIVKIVASEMAKSLRHKDEPGKLMVGQAFTAALSDFLLCPTLSSKIDHKNACYKSMMEVVRSVTPKELIDCLLQVITIEPRHLNKSRLVFDEFDGSYIENDVEMDDFQTDDFQSPILEQKINQDNFSEHDKLRIRYMEILSTCLCASYDSRKVDGLVGNVQSFILDYFESEDFDVVKPLHSKLLFSAAFILGCGRIKPKHFLIILQKLRHSISKFRKDQEYCREGLRLMTVLAKQFAMETEDEEDMKEARELILHLLKAFWNLRETNYQSSVRLQLAKCMDALIRFDPNKKWAFFELKNNNNVSLVHISHVFPQLLCDPSHQVRMYMAEAIGILFLKFNSENMAVPENPVIQDELFDIVADALAKALVVERDLANAESEDEGNNRASSLLSAFKNIATASCWCEPKVVCLLLQATKEQKLDQELVAKVIQQISVTIGYQSTHQFIKTHIGRVIDSWLNHGFQLVDFPFQALGFKSLADFLRAHHASIMPHLIWRFNDKASLKTIGREIGNNGDWTEFLMLDFCQIMSIIVPRFAEQSCQTNISDGVFGLDRRKELDAEKQKAYDCHGFLETVLRKEITDKLMVNKFDELIVELLLRMHDAPSELSDVSQFLRDYDPPTDKPHFTSHAIKATLDYLTKCHDGSNTLVSILCKRKVYGNLCTYEGFVHLQVPINMDRSSIVNRFEICRENIQKILLRLSEHLEETHVFHKRRSFLAMYRLFVLLLLQELNTGLAGTWAFVVRDIVYTLIRIISTNNAPNILMINGMTRDEQINIQLDGDLFTASCDLLYQVCKVALSCCSQEIGHHLLVIANEITPFVSKNDNRAKKAVALLRFLIVDNKSSLQSAISLLDPFPDQPEFAVFNEAYWSVRQNTHATGLSAEIDHYLLISSRCPTASRLEGLRYLCSRFDYYKNELRDATRIDLNGSSLGVKLMKLLRYLIKLCKKSTSEVKVEVGKLFAEVGLPVLYVSFFNLTTSEAEDENNSYTKACEVFRGDEEKCRNCCILHILNHCLIDRSITKVAAAASCLRDIFEKRTILTMMKTYQEQKIDHLFGYLEPFKPGKRQKTSEQSESPKGSTLENVLKDSDLWSPGNFNCHDEWISALTSAIILSGGVMDEVLKCLAPICKVHSSFADRIFPYLIHAVLSSHGEAYRVLLSEQIRRIFSSHVLSCSNQSRASTPLITAAENTISNAATHDSIHSVLNVVNYLRKQPRPKLGKSFTTSWESNFWLDLNFLELAEAALKSSGYCTAILYIEIWRDIQRASSSSSVEEVCSDEQYIPMEVCSESTDESQETNYQTILFEAYASIGEPDAVYGSGMSTDLKARIHTYEQEKCWGKALRAYDIHCRQSDNQPCVGTIQALQTFGLEHVTYKYLKGLGDENQEEFLELQYESAWRNRIWTVEKDISDKFSVNNRGFNKCVYDSIQSLRNKEFKLFRSSINECRLQIVEDLCRTNTESLWEVYPRISRLQCLVELEQAETICERSGDHEILLNNWIVNMPESFSEFLEPILSLRSILLQELLTLSQNDETALEKRHSLIQGIMKHNEMVSKLARHAGRYQISEKAIITLKDLQKTGENALATSYSWKIEEAKVFWFQGEHETAMRLLRQINYVIKHEPMISKLLYAQTLGLYGSWLAETRSENSNTIMEKYLEKAVELVESCNDKQESTIEAFLSLARFADSQYKNIQDYMKSWAFENKQTIMNKLKSEIADLKDLGHEKGRYIRELSLQSESDERELTQLKEDRLKYLQKAIKNYSKCLQVGGKYDLKIFRICSLWMENSNDDSINEIVKQGIFTKAGEPLTESRKFLPLMYQLAARLGARTHSNELFQKTLTKLISQAAVDHPHHVIWIILALCNAAKDNQYLNCGKKSSRLSRTSGKNQVNSYVDEDRVKAARAVIEIVRSSQRNLVSSMEKLSEAYIELAYYDVSQHKNNTGPLSLPELALKRISNLRNVALPTADIQIDPTCRYQDIVSIAKFDPTYQLCGGINLPKILLCIGSDGVKRRQLIKGKDDLRQDAVMQQVFGMVNTLLQKNVETRKRNLKIRTYKVVPLSQRSGLVEWCEETTPLGNYLIGGQARVNGAHQRYNPKDWSSLECRKKIQVVDRSNVNRRFTVYKELTAHFHPVFRHFFLEKFPDPSIWFEKRLGYTRSVATASIVGYIVGLGDRHVQNILIDCNTAELIHIDLGVAFEQGKMLPTPETVPFRLTRDLVDGMGISGVEGVFRRCCEKTMEVMRTSQEALLTIVEVLLYDPLYVWTLSPLKAMSLQRKADMDTSDVAPSNTDVLETGNEGEARESLDETSVNKMAERVLVRLGQKLDGIEDGTLLSVKGQVNHLIREAKDPKNLCRLFPGWQPWI